MITSSTLGINGRLGNQLFQYAALRGLSLKHGYSLRLPRLTHRVWHGQRCLLRQFNIPETVYNSVDCLPENIYVEPNYMEYDPKFLELPDNVDIAGYFQSIKYFEHVKDDIKRELTPNQKWVDTANGFITQFKKNKNREFVSLHIRRGDSTDGSNHVLTNMYGDNDVLDLESFGGSYIKKAIDYFNSFLVNPIFVVFTGGRRFVDSSEDHAWCKKNLEEKFDNEFLVLHNPPMLDFALIGACDHNIISHISSFGWWAAYIGNNDSSGKKKTVAPNRYHPDRPHLMHREGFYPDNWILL